MGRGRVAFDSEIFDNLFSSVRDALKNDGAPQIVADPKDGMRYFESINSTSPRSDLVATDALERPTAGHYSHSHHHDTHVTSDRKEHTGKVVRNQRCSLEHPSTEAAGQKKYAVQETTKVGMGVWGSGRSFGTLHEDRALVASFPDRYDGRLADCQTKTLQQIIRDEGDETLRDLRERRRQAASDRQTGLRRIADRQEAFVHLTEHRLARARVARMLKSRRLRDQQLDASRRLQELLHECLGEYEKVRLKGERRRRLSAEASDLILERMILDLRWFRFCSRLEFDALGMAKVYDLGDPTELSLRASLRSFVGRGGAEGTGESGCEGVGALVASRLAPLLSRAGLEHARILRVVAICPWDGDAGHGDARGRRNTHRGVNRVDRLRVGGIGADLCGDVADVHGDGDDNDIDPSSLVVMKTGGDTPLGVADILRKALLCWNPALCATLSGGSSAISGIKCVPNAPAGSKRSCPGAEGASFQGTGGSRQRGRGTDLAKGCERWPRVVGSDPGLLLSSSSILWVLKPTFDEGYGARFLEPTVSRSDAGGDDLNEETREASSETRESSSVGVDATWTKTSRNESAQGRAVEGTRLSGGEPVGGNNRERNAWDVAWLCTSPVGSRLYYCLEEVESASSLHRRQSSRTRSSHPLRPLVTSASPRPAAKPARNGYPMPKDGLITSRSGTSVQVTERHTDDDGFYPESSFRESQDLPGEGPNSAMSRARNVRDALAAVYMGGLKSLQPCSLEDLCPAEAKPLSSLEERAKRGDTGWELLHSSLSDPSSSVVTSIKDEHRHEGTLKACGLELGKEVSTALASFPDVLVVRRSLDGSRQRCASVAHGHRQPSKGTQSAGAPGELPRCFDDNVDATQEESPKAVGGVGGDRDRPSLPVLHFVPAQVLQLLGTPHYREFVKSLSPECREEIEVHYGDCPNPPPVPHLYVPLAPPPPSAARRPSTLPKNYSFAERTGGVAGSPRQLNETMGGEAAHQDDGCTTSWTPPSTVGALLQRLPTRAIRELLQIHVATTRSRRSNAGAREGAAGRKWSRCGSGTSGLFAWRDQDRSVSRPCGGKIRLPEVKQRPVRSIRSAGVADGQPQEIGAGGDSPWKSSSTNSRLGSGTSADGCPPSTVDTQRCSRRRVEDEERIDGMAQEGRPPSGGKTTLSRDEAPQGGLSRVASSPPSAVDCIPDAPTLCGNLGGSGSRRSGHAARVSRVRRPVCRCDELSVSGQAGRPYDSNEIIAGDCWIDCDGAALASECSEDGSLRGLQSRVSKDGGDADRDRRPVQTRRREQVRRERSATPEARASRARRKNVRRESETKNGDEPSFISSSLTAPFRRSYVAVLAREPPSSAVLNTSDDDLQSADIVESASTGGLDVLSRSSTLFLQLESGAQEHEAFGEGSKRRTAATEKGNRSSVNLEKLSTKEGGAARGGGRSASKGGHVLRDASDICLWRGCLADDTARSSLCEVHRDLKDFLDNKAAKDEHLMVCCAMLWEDGDEKGSKERQPFPLHSQELSIALDEPGCIAAGLSGLPAGPADEARCASEALRFLPPGAAGVKRRGSLQRGRSGVGADGRASSSSSFSSAHKLGAGATAKGHGLVREWSTEGSGVSELSGLSSSSPLLLELFNGTLASTIRMFCRRVVTKGGNRRSRRRLSTAAVGHERRYERTSTHNAKHLAVEAPGWAKWADPAEVKAAQGKLKADLRWAEEVLAVERGVTAEARRLSGLGIYPEAELAQIHQEYDALALDWRKAVGGMDGGASRDGGGGEEDERKSGEPRGREGRSQSDTHVDSSDVPRQSRRVDESPEHERHRPKVPCFAATQAPRAQALTRPAQATADFSASDISAAPATPQRSSPSNERPEARVSGVQPTTASNQGAGVGSDLSCQRKSSFQGRGVLTRAFSSPDVGSASRIARGDDEGRRPLETDCSDSSSKDERSRESLAEGGALAPRSEQEIELEFCRLKRTLLRRRVEVELAKMSSWGQASRSAMGMVSTHPRVVIGSHAVSRDLTERGERSLLAKGRPPSAEGQLKGGSESRADSVLSSPCDAGILPNRSSSSCSGYWLSSGVQEQQQQQQWQQQQQQATGPRPHSGELLPSSNGSPPAYPQSQGGKGRGRRQRGPLAAEAQGGAALDRIHTGPAVASSIGAPRLEAPILPEGEGQQRQLQSHPRRSSGSSSQEYIPKISRATAGSSKGIRGSGSLESDSRKGRRSNGTMRDALGDGRRRASSLPRGSRKVPLLKPDSFRLRRRHPRGFDATPYETSVFFRDR